MLQRTRVLGANIKYWLVSIDVNPCSIFKLEACLFHLQRLSFFRFSTLLI